MITILMFIICLLLVFIFWYFIKFYICLLRIILYKLEVDFRIVQMDFHIPFEQWRHDLFIYCHIVFILIFCYTVG